ncbi:transposase [Tamlana haliotis]|uniref:Transposase n=1 Tax=Pseudotamlana haliotis TaxID=2614804 RepID=A0A6N6MH61_9FLAO|nr:transposase [Tamlana haliotis]
MISFTTVTTPDTVERYRRWINRFRYTSYNQLYKSIEQYLNWYNTKRLHSSLGYMTPLEKGSQLKGFINKAA